MLKVLCKSYKRKRKTDNRNESEKKEELAQLGRTQGPKPGSSPAPAEPA
jgi:hypothetical protein